MGSLVPCHSMMKRSVLAAGSLHGPPPLQQVPWGHEFFSPLPFQQAAPPGLIAHSAVASTCPWYGTSYVGKVHEARLDGSLQGPPECLHLDGQRQ